LEAFNNFCFSNELEFRFYKEKKLVNTVSIAQIINGKLIPNESSFDTLEELLRDFLSYK